MSTAAHAAAQFFAVGTGRCGSTMFSELMRLNPDVLSLSELWTVLGGGDVLQRSLDGRELWELMSTSSDDLSELLSRAEVPEVLAGGCADAMPSAVAGLAPLLLITLPHLCSRPDELLCEIGEEVRPYRRDRAATHFARLFAWLCRKLGRSLWVERSGASLEYAPALASEFPTARFVHVARDGRDCAYSMGHHPFFRVKLARTLAGDPRLPIADCLARQIGLDRFGAYWSALMLRQARRLHELGPERVMLLRYDELTHAPDRQLGRVASFLELGAAIGPWLELARTRVQRRPARWSSLPHAERHKLERACLPGMRLLDRLSRA